MEKEHFSSISVFNNFSLYSKFEKAMMRLLKESNFNVEKEYVFNKNQTLVSEFFFETIDGDVEHAHMLCF